MDRDEVEDVVSLLRRAHVLEACRDGPIGRTAVAERADCSRTTAYRATGDLADEGLLERTPEGYRLTGTGAATLDRIRAFRADVEGVDRLGPVLAHVDAPAVVENAALFADATVIEAEPGTPYGIEQHLTALIEDVDREIFAVTTSVGAPSTVDGTHERVAAGVDYEHVFTRQAYDRLVDGYGGVADDIADRDNVGLFVVETSPVDLVVYDDTLVLVGFDDTGLVTAVATTDDEEARAWARQLFDDHKRRGERVA